MWLVLIIFTLTVEKLVDDLLDSFIDDLNVVVLTWIAPHVPEVAFALMWVFVWAWFREGWRPFGWTKKNPDDVDAENADDDDYPLKDDLIELNKLVRICANRLKGLGVLANLDVVRTSLDWTGLVKGLQRHDIAYPPEGADNNELYSYLIDLDDPTRRGKITESRRVGNQHHKAISDRLIETNNSTLEDTSNRDDDEQRDDKQESHRQ